MRRLTIILDVDGVLMPCISAAIPIVKEKYGYEINYEDVTEWNFTNFPEPVRNAMMAVVKSPDFVKAQKPFEHAQEMVKELIRRGHRVMIFSAVPPDLMGYRAESIMKFFPEVSLENITLGGNKSLMAGDILLDDGLHNIVTSHCRYPILMRRPWNNKEKKILSVRNYQEFLELTDQISNAPEEYERKATHSGHPGLVALVGPSASGKSMIITEILKDPRFALATATTTRPPRTNDRLNEYHFVDKNEFEEMIRRGEFLEYTQYAGNYYGVSMKDLQDIWDKGRIPIKAMDMNGASNAKKKLGSGVISVFIRRDKKKVINTLIERVSSGISSSADVSKRIMMLDQEYANEPLCDWSVSNNGLIKTTVQQLLNIL